MRALEHSNKQLRHGSSFCGGRLHRISNSRLAQTHARNSTRNSRTLVVVAAAAAGNERSDAAKAPSGDAGSSNGQSGNSMPGGCTRVCVERLPQDADGAHTTRYGTLGAFASSPPPPPAAHHVCLRVTHAQPTTHRAIRLPAATQQVSCWHHASRVPSAAQRTRAGRQAHPVCK